MLVPLAENTQERMESKHFGINSAIFNPMLFFALQRVAMGGQVLIPRRWVDDRSLAQTRGEQRKRPRFEPVRTYFALNAPLREVRREFAL